MFFYSLLSLSLLLVLGQDALGSPVLVGEIEIDPPTICCIGIAVPIISGDSNFNSRASLSYRRSGSANWSQALPLLRVRPDTLGSEDPPENFGLPRPQNQYAGSIFDLEPNVSYEVKVTIADPDGGDTELTAEVRTRALPLDIYSAGREISVSTSPELVAALSGAQPGDVITLADGTYAGTFTLESSGTPEQPIVIRGAQQQSTVIDADNGPYGISISGQYIYVENLSIRNAEWAVLADNTSEVVLRKLHIYQVPNGIRATSSRNLYICDNQLEGTVAVWPDVSRATWGAEGIMVSGQGHSICNNTVSGFGDSLGLSNNTDIPNIAVDFFGNEVLWGGDDAIELDFAHRNVRAFRNRLSNSGMGISTQPAWGGPIYIYRNVIVNMAHSPYKLNNDPTGLLIFHNTSVRTLGVGNYSGSAFPQFGGVVSNFQFKNNINVGLSGPNFTSDIVLGEIDFNAWQPDGVFVFSQSWPSFESMRTNSPYEANGRLLANQAFRDNPGIPVDYTTLVPPVDLTLSSQSGAIDAGLVLPNLNDDFLGAGPDLGALELGLAVPTYGARRADTGSDTRPAPPSDLIVE